MNELELKLNRFLFFHGASSRRRLWLKLAKLLANGVPIVDAVKSIHDRRLESSGPHDSLVTAMAVWLERLRNGSRLAAALEGWVPRDEQMLVRAGEESGRLEDALVNATQIMDAKRKIRKAVMGGMAYPFVLVSAAILMLVMFSFKVIPMFASIVPDEKWQGVGRLMIDVAEFSRNWIWLVVLLLVALSIAFFMSLPRWSEGMRRKLDRYPPYNVYRILHGSSWMISLAALVAAGMRLESALQQLGEGGSRWLEARTTACLRGMRSGLALGDALAKSGYGFPDIEIIDDLGVYARLSGVDQALALIGKEWITESVEKIQEMMKVIFGISLLFAGLFIAFLVGGLISMELQMSSIVQGSYR